MSEEVETIDGFDIPKRELTAEEAATEITAERIRSFHYEVGEDYLDQNSEGGQTAFVFGGWLLHKYPEHSVVLLAHMNESNRLDIHSFKDLEEIYEYNSDFDLEGIYWDFAEFANQTEALKKRINQILIQIEEYYA